MHSVMVVGVVYVACLAVLFRTAQATFPSSPNVDSDGGVAVHFRGRQDAFGLGEVRTIEIFDGMDDDITGLSYTFAFKFPQIFNLISSPGDIYLSGVLFALEIGDQATDVQMLAGLEIFNKPGYRFQGYTLKVSQRVRCRYPLAALTKHNQNALPVSWTLYCPADSQPSSVLPYQHLCPLSAVLSPFCPVLSCPILTPLSCHPTTSLVLPRPLPPLPPFPQLLLNCRTCAGPQPPILELRRNQLELPRFLYRLRQQRVLLHADER